jgi:hypothetical protein
MPFKASKEKGFTRILFVQAQRWRSYLYIVFVWLQSLLIYLLGLFFEWAQDLVAFSIVLSVIVSIMILLDLFVQKSLKLTKEGFGVEYTLFGLLLYKKVLLWSELSKVAVEQDRLKTYDIVFVTQRKSVFLHEAMDLDASDALLKEIQLFHHYKA